MAEASIGKRFILTARGYTEISKVTQTTLKPGFPIKGFEQMVPMAWLYNGYVTER